jgi:hypothetical protein
MNNQVVTRRAGIGRCRMCGISPQLVKEGRCYECQDRAPQLKLTNKEAK